jgi:hypothetical protein
LQKLRGHHRYEIDIECLDQDDTILEVHEQIARVGGSGASIYSASIGGWDCVMKSISPDFCDIDAVEREIALLETLPPHPNIVRYGSFSLALAGSRWLSVLII